MSRLVGGEATDWPLLLELFMATLQKTFGGLYGDVMNFLGWTTATLTTPVLSANIDEAKKLANDAYLKFINSHDWSFLKPEWQLTTIAGQWEYPLPENFRKFETTRLMYSPDNAYPPLRETNVANILTLRSSDDSEGSPELYALKADSYDPKFGQRMNILFYRAPDASYTLNGLMSITPVKLEDDADLPIGGIEHSGLLKQMCLAEAERQGDKSGGLQQSEADRMLMRAMQIDDSRNPRCLGKLTDPKYQGIGEIIGLRNCDTILYDGIDTRTSGL